MTAGNGASVYSVHSSVDAMMSRHVFEIRLRPAILLVAIRVAKTVLILRPSGVRIPVALRRLSAFRMSTLKSPASIMFEFDCLTLVSRSFRSVSHAAGAEGGRYALITIALWFFPVLMRMIIHSIVVDCSMMVMREALSSHRLYTSIPPPRWFRRSSRNKSYPERSSDECVVDSVSQVSSNVMMSYALRFVLCLKSFSTFLARPWTFWWKMRSAPFFVARVGLLCVRIRGSGWIGGVYTVGR